MRKIKFIIPFILFAFSNNLFSQQGTGIIFFEDGNETKIYINNIYKYKTLKKQDKPIERIELNDEKSKKLIIYEYIQLKKKKVLARVIYKGTKVSLYSRYVLHNREPFYPSPSSASENNPSGDIHYAKKKGDQFVTEISFEGGQSIYGNKFRKKAIRFFSDCPNLVKLIKNHKIKNKEKIQAFKYYDEKCNQ